MKNQVKVLCHTCDGDKFVVEVCIDDDGSIYEEDVVCYECNGAGFVFAEKYEGK